MKVNTLILGMILLAALGLYLAGVPLYSFFILIGIGHLSIALTLKKEEDNRAFKWWSGIILGMLFLTLGLLRLVG